MQLGDNLQIDELPAYILKQDGEAMLRPHTEVYLSENAVKKHFKSVYYVIYQLLRQRYCTHGQVSVRVRTAKNLSWAIGLMILYSQKH